MEACGVSQTSFSEELAKRLCILGCSEEAQGLDVASGGAEEYGALLYQQRAIAEEMM